MFGRKHPPEPTKEPELWLYADDDLMTRAEKIVQVCGFRGATGAVAINVFRVLQQYAELDRKRSEKSSSQAEY